MYSLTSEQLQYIFTFLEKKRVIYKDVQYELADHIASRVEEIQETDSKVTFENAVYQVYKSFGIFGFTKVVQKKSEELNKQWLLKFKSYLFEYFKLPKIIITFSLTILVFLVLGKLATYPDIIQISNDRQFVTMVIVSPMILLLLEGIFMRKYKPQEYLSLASFQTAKVIINFHFFQIFAWGAWIPLTSSAALDNLIIRSFFSIFMAAAIILFHAYFFKFKEMYEEEVTATYEKFSLELGHS